MRKNKGNHDTWEAKQREKTQKRLAEHRGKSDMLLAFALRFRNKTHVKGMTRGEAKRKAIKEEGY